MAPLEVTSSRAKELGLVVNEMSLEETVSISMVAVWAEVIWEV